MGGAVGGLIGKESNYTVGGFGLRFAYTMENLRLDGHIGGVGGEYKHAISIGVGAAWVPFNWEISPYVGGGVSYIGLFVPHYGNKQMMSLDVSIGVELARLQLARFLVEFRSQFPLHSEELYYKWVPQGWFVIMF